MSVTLGAGTRLPAYCTSLGRVLLAQLSEENLDRYLAQVPLGARTEHTVTDPARLRDILATVRQEGYAINSEELELGLRSIAVPVRGGSGRVQAALIAGAQAGRVGEAQMTAQFLPVLCEAAQELAYLLP
jgi:IclR family pca regulon transcriptional regulator